MLLATGLAAVVTGAVIQRLAHAAAFDRGVRDATRNTVVFLENHKHTLKAVIRTDDGEHTVTLANDDGLLEYDCDCGSDFCRHCVAAGVRWLQLARAGKKPKKITLATARKMFEDEEPEVILNLLFEWAKDNPRLRERILLYAAGREGPGRRSGQPSSYSEMQCGCGGSCDTGRWAAGLGG